MSAGCTTMAMVENRGVVLTKEPDICTFIIVMLFTFTANTCKNYSHPFLLFVYDFYAYVADRGNMECCCVEEWQSLPSSLSFHFV